MMMLFEPFSFSTLNLKNRRNTLPLYIVQFLFDIYKILWFNSGKIEYRIRRVYYGYL